MMGWRSGLQPGNRDAPPLFAQLVGLLVITFTLIQLAGGAIVFLAPPSNPPIMHLSEVAASLRAKSPALANGVSRTSASIRYLPHLARDSAKEAWLAGHMALPTGSVRVGLGANPFLVTRFQDKTSLDPVLFMPFYAAVQQPDGGWLELRADRPLFGEIASRLALWLLATTAIIAPIAFVLARRLTRPISSFALGAERLGQDPRAPRLEVTGPAEVQSAVRAFNGMQDKLRSYVEHRVRLVAAIAHDLRTPLTRLKIQIEALPDEVRPRAEREITLMDAMIESTLAFVKDADTLQDRHRLHLLSLVESVADDLSDIGQDVDVEQGGDPVIEGDPLALRRLVTNLIDNAVKFGGKARCRVYVDGDTAVIQIDDDGPGIPDRDLERLFEPFVRGEESLYRETGGIGLGLSIVRTIAHAHGGVATLGNRLGGGLRAETRIPLAQT